MVPTRVAAVIVLVGFASQCTGYTVPPASACLKRAFVSIHSFNSALHAGAAVVEAPSAVSPANDQPKKKKKKKPYWKNGRKKKAQINGGGKQGEGREEDFSPSAKLTKKGDATETGKKNGPQSKNSRRKKKKPALKPMSELVIDSKIDGVVGGLSEFGAFVKTRYAIRPEQNKGNKKQGYALLHKSQIQDEKVEDISNVLRVGDQIKNARVIGINYVEGEVAISLRKPRPKRKPLSAFQVGKEYDGKIANVTPYGAFVDIGAKKNALLHISRISQEKITNIREYVNEADFVTVRIVEKDEKKQTMACSMLEREADEYLNKKRRQMQRKKENQQNGVDAAAEVKPEKTDLEVFDAIRELEEALRDK